MQTFKGPSETFLYQVNYGHFAFQAGQALSLNFAAKDFVCTAAPPSLFNDEN